VERKHQATQFALSEMEVAIESRRKELVPITTDELLAMEIPAIQWVIPNTIPIPGLVALSSKPGVGKTNLVTWICWQASQGLPAFRALDGDDLGFLKQENHEPIKTLIIQEGDFGAHHAKPYQGLQRQITRQYAPAHVLQELQVE
jgi:hypothetical protein